MRNTLSYPPKYYKPKSFNETLMIHQLFELQVKKSPNSIAIIADNAQVTYNDLNKAANKLARYLISELHEDIPHNSQGCFIGVMLDRSLDLIIAILAIIKSGNTYVPMDYNHPENRVIHILNDTNIPYILSKSSIKQKINSILNSQLLKSKYNILFIDKEWNKINTCCDENLDIQLESSETSAYVIYTSGSTGNPKGVVIKHAGIVSLLHWAIKEFNEGLHCVLFSTSICFDISAFEIFAPLSYGGKIYIAENILDLVSKPPKVTITLLNTVPSLMLIILKHTSLPASLKTIILAGEPIPNTVIMNLTKEMPQTKLYNLYGPTETTIYSSYHQIKTSNFPQQLIGKPVDNTQIYILDEHLNPVSEGKVGEIFIGGIGVSSGYINNPQITNEKFILNPFIKPPPNYIYKTGDLGCYTIDEIIKYCGRIDDQVKIRGYRIELIEIEACFQHHPSVVNAAVALIKVDQQDELVGFIATKNNISQQTLRDYIKSFLPSYMVPSLQNIILVNELPKNANGKIDKQLLVNNYISSIGKKDKVGENDDNNEEYLVRIIWSKILKLKNIKPDFNFFEMGGTSINALELTIELNKVLGARVLFSDIFIYPVFSKFIDHICDNKDKKLPITHFPTKADHYPLTLEQIDKHYVSQNKSSVINNLVFYFEVNERLNIDLFKKAIDVLTKRHQILSSNIFKLNNTLYFKNMNAHEHLLQCVNIASFTKKNRDRYLDLELNKYQSVEVNFSNSPLFFTKLYIISKNTFIILIYVHHILVDLISLKIIQSELVHVYKKLYKESTFSLPPVKSFADFAYNEKHYLKQDIINDKLSFIASTLINKKRIIEFDRLNNLPNDTGGCVTIIANSNVSDTIKNFAANSKITPFVSFLTLFKKTLLTHFNRTSFAVGSIVSNRSYMDSMSSVGHYSNYIVIQNDFLDNISLSQMITQIHEKFLTAIAYIDIPYSLLRNTVNKIEGNTTYNPLFNIFFDYQPSHAKSNLFLEHSNNIMSNCNIVTRDLSVRITELEGKLKFSARYKGNLFSQEEIHNLLRNFINLCYNYNWGL